MVLVFLSTSDGQGTKKKKKKVRIFGLIPFTPSCHPSVSPRI
jgi:hypothetical protein